MAHAISGEAFAAVLNWVLTKEQVLGRKLSKMRILGRRPEVIVVQRNLNISILSLLVVGSRALFG